MPENYIGIMCGTSLDSLDFSLCCFEKVKKLKTFKSYRINQKLKDKINLCKTKPNNLSLFNETDKEVTQFIISCLQKFIISSKVNKIKAFILFTLLDIINFCKQLIINWVTSLSVSLNKDKLFGFVLHRLILSLSF